MTGLSKGPYSPGVGAFAWLLRGCAVCPLVGCFWLGTPASCETPSDREPARWVKLRHEGAFANQASCWYLLQLVVTGDRTRCGIPVLMPRCFVVWWARLVR
jgi:hypothetical protein